MRAYVYSSAGSRGRPLLVDQMRGNDKVKNEGLKPLHMKDLHGSCG